MSIGVLSMNNAIKPDAILRAIAAQLVRCNLTSGEQLAMAVEIERLSSEVGSMQRFCDETVAEAQEDAAISEHEAMLREQGAAPLRRVPVRQVVPEALPGNVVRLEVRT